MCGSRLLSEEKRRVGGKGNHGNDKSTAFPLQFEARIRIFASPPKSVPDDKGK